MKLVQVLTLTGILLSACGGDSSSVTEPNNPEINDPQQPSVGLPSGSGLNGGLVGRIITTYNQMPVQFDLFTGQVRELPVDTIQDWLVLMPV